MKLRNFLFGLFFVMVSMLDFESDLDEYQKLEIKNVSSIRREDLPSDFSDEAFKTVDEFIRKTRDLNYEFVIYFDYVTGEILKCVKGGKDAVSFDFEDGEFEGYLVASIHNHPEDVYSPPSGKNFGILVRNFEDCELIASVNELWILKVKGFHINLLFEFKFMAELFLKASFDDAKLKYDDWNEINDKCEEEYGYQLSKYIMIKT